MLMSKLTKTQWIVARAKWEWSEQDGFQWLATELGVSRPAVAQRAKAEHWTKKVTQEVTLVDDDINEPEQLITPTNNPIGRPTSYQESYVHWGYQLCFLGATDKQLAQAFGVSEQTINTWKKKHPEFLESINRGKLYADATVAHALYKLAIGEHTVTETQETEQGATLTTVRTVPRACVFSFVHFTVHFVLVTNFVWLLIW